MNRKICVVTGSRAEYGLLRPLMEEIKKDKRLKLSIVATAMHLSPEFGMTYKEIEKNGFHITGKLPIGLRSDTPEGILKSMGIAMRALAAAYEKIGPDLIVIVGDRFEIFGAALAALVKRIPIAHIHGGEVTEGAFDDSFRHSITKMSHLHFTASEDYRKRVIQLGEDPRRVFNVGALGLDNIKRLKLLTKKPLERILGIKFNRRNLLVTFHPATLEENASGLQFQNLLDALDERADTTIIFTKANADIGGRTINRMIDKYVSRNSWKSKAFISMGQLKYLSTMRFVDGVIGNSSSGIIEAPSFKIGTINIGDRQKGRIKAESVIDSKPAKEEIRRAFEKLYSTRFQRALRDVVNPFGDGNTAARIKQILSTYHLDNILKKPFYDIV